ncbi:MAG: Lar family restriction alleviation protein [Treponema sp.]|jgi:Lar family restriction alleviation protein|nr:Lar family restriction alleviation protein [Treponema sp.]
MTNEALKRCPFCGGEALLKRGRPIYFDYFFVKCSSCGIETPECKYEPDGAIAAWNTRVGEKNA